MKNIKNKLCVFLATLFCMSSLTGCEQFGGLIDNNKPEQPITGDPVWSAFATQTEGYVYELYNFDVPTVTAPDGRELKVKVTAKDKDGNVLDTTGGFFAVREEAAYTLTYSVEYDGKTYSKTATVMGIPKTEYTLNTVPLYGVNEEIDLTKHVNSSVEGRIDFSVRKDGKAVVVTNGKITPTSVGTYNVTATVEKQPDYEYAVTVVDKSLYPYPNGLVTDREDDSAFTAKIEEYLNEGENIRPIANLTENASVSVSHSDETYYGEGNGSTKISVDFPNTSKAFMCDISYKPEFDVSYYKSLQMSGYENIAVRMKVNHSNPNTEKEYNIWNLRPFKKDSSSMNITALNKVGDEIFNKTSYIIWSDNAEMAQGEWIELLLPISQFVSRYNKDGMTLFKYVTTGEFKVGNKIFDNMYGTLDIMIDNIYAVKPITATAPSFTDKELNSEYVMSELSLGDETDVDNTMNSVTVNGKKVAVTNGKFTLDKSGLYSVERRAKNRYGYTKTVLSTVNINNVQTTLREFTAENYTSLRVANCEVAWDETYSAAKVTLPNVSASGAVLHYHDILVETDVSKDYLEYVTSKTSEYKYVTVRVGLPNGSNMYATTGLDTHYGNFKPDYAAANVYKLNASSVLELTKKVENWNGKFDWFVYSVSIEDFIKNMDGNVAKIFRVLMTSNPETVYISGVYLTKDGKIPQ